MKATFTGILVLILIAFSSYGQENAGITKQEKQAIIDKAIVLLKENYVFPNRVDNIEKHINERLTAGGYDSLANAETFLASLNADLEHYGNDHHLDISYGPKRVKQIIALMLFRLLQAATPFVHLLHPSPGRHSPESSQC